MKERFVNLLRWSEKYTKTDMVYLFKGGFWLTLGQILTAGGALLISVAFANILPQDIYGIYKYTISIFGILAITTLPGLNVSLTQAITKGFEGDIKKILKTKIWWGLLGTLAGIGTAFYYFLQGNSTLAIVFVIAAVFVPFLNPLSIYGSILQGKKDFKTYSIFNILSKIFETAALIITLLLTKNIFILILVFFASNTIINGIFSLIIFAKQKFNKLKDVDTLSYGKHLSALNVVVFLAGQLDKILVFQFIGAAELAIYAFATAPLDQLKGLFKNINFLAWPKFAKAPLESRTPLFQKMKRLAFFIIAISILYALAAPLIFRAIFPQYVSAVPYSQILGLSLFAGILMEFGRSFIEARGAKKEYYRYSIGVNIFSLAILFPFIYFWGLWGAVAARTLTRFVGLILSIFFIKNLGKNELNDCTPN